jgi:hypothetical protein
MFKVVRLLPLCALATGACANYSQLQDAETMPKGKLGVGVGVSFTKYTVEETDTAGTKTEESISVPAVVVSARRGITDKFEVQGTAWFPLGARLGGKYQLAGEAGKEGLQVSVGAHVGYLSISAGEAKTTFIDGYLPLYLGYRASPSLEIYAVPQYILRLVGNEDNTSDVGHVTGTTLGIALGRSSKLFLEAGGFYDTLYGTAIVNTAVGLGF